MEGLVGLARRTVAKIQGKQAKARINGNGPTVRPTSFRSLDWQSLFRSAQNEAALSPNFWRADLLTAALLQHAIASWRWGPLAQGQHQACFARRRVPEELTAPPRCGRRETPLDHRSFGQWSAERRRGCKVPQTVSSNMALGMKTLSGEAASPGPTRIRYPLGFVRGCVGSSHGLSRLLHDGLHGQRCRRSHREALARSCGRQNVGTAQRVETRQSVGCTRSMFSGLISRT